MRSTLIVLASTVLAMPVSAQSVVPAGTPVVVTTDGLFVPHPSSSTPRLFASASAIAGTTTLQGPAIEWELGTDSFLVTSGPGLYRVTITSLSPATFTVTDLTPSSALALHLFDLDMHPGTGELFVLDQTQDVVLRYAPPFAAGMSAVDAIPVPPSARAIAIDSRAHPNALDVAESSQVTRIPLDGSGSTDVAFLPFAGGLDHDVETAGVQGTFMVAKGSHDVLRATAGPSLAVDLNLILGCTPLALAPVDIEWNSLTHRAFALAEDGLNPACATLLPATGPNHVVRFPIAQGPVFPTLATFDGGSGITGINGDLAVVVGDFGYVATYGQPCVPFAAGGPVLDVDEFVITPSSPGITFTIAQAPPVRVAALMIGATPLQTLLPSGCSLFVSQDLLEIIGTTDAQGALTVHAPIGPLPQGLEFFVQALVDSPSGVTLSEAVAIHVGP